MRERLLFLFTFLRVLTSLLFVVPFWLVGVRKSKMGSLKKKIKLLQ